MNINTVIKRCGSPALARILRASPRIGEESGQRKLAKALRSGEYPNLLADLHRIRQEAFDLEKFMYDSDDSRDFALISGVLSATNDKTFRLRWRWGAM